MHVSDSHCASFSSGLPRTISTFRAICFRKRTPSLPTPASTQREFHKACRSDRTSKKPRLLSSEQSDSSPISGALHRVLDAIFELTETQCELNAIHLFSTAPMLNNAHRVSYLHSLADSLKPDVQQLGAVASAEVSEPQSKQCFENHGHPKPQLNGEEEKRPQAMVASNNGAQQVKRGNVAENDPPSD